MNFMRVTWAMSAIVWLVIVVMACLFWGWPALVVVLAFGLFPDIALIGGFAERGRLKPDRVKLYNTLHITTWPIVTIVLGVIIMFVTGGFEGGFWALALGGVAWFVHIALDRALGFGLRDADGTIIPVGLEFS
ncbi:MAG: DUF4260 family protein [Leucobacter sp.]